MASSKRVNNAGIIFFHPRPADVLPQVEIKLVRFKGTSASMILDTVFLSRPMLQMLSGAERFVLRNIRTSFEFRGLDRVEVVEHPVSVIREELVNSVAHRDYFDPNTVQINIFDDRIEFMSPGRLPEWLTVDTLGAYSVQRNPTIYKLLRDVRKVEGLALGIVKMMEALRDGGYSPPAFEELGNGFFRVTVRNKEFPGQEHLSRPRRGFSGMSVKMDR